jgi:hypothetical protein
MPARRMTLPELESAWGAIEAAIERPLSVSEKEMLASQVHRLNSDVWIMWRVWSPSFNQQAKLLAELAKKTKAARHALGALADGDWDPQWSTISHLVSKLYSLRVKTGKSGRTDAARNAVGAEMKGIHESLGEIAAAATLASKERAEVAKEYRLVRGHDKAAALLVEDLAKIWRSKTGTEPDAWVDKETKEYRGKFWNFVKASTVVVREFMGEKATNGALFSRVERLTRKHKGVRPRQSR